MRSRICLVAAFLQGELKRNPGWLFGFWLAWLASGWLLAGFGWLLTGFWLSKKRHFLAGFLAGLAGFLAGLAGFLGLAWLLAGFLAGLAGFWLSKKRLGFLAALAWLLAGFLAGLAGFGWLGPFFLARLAETQLRGKLQAYLGVVMLQPHASTQRFRLRILRRTRSFPGRTRIESIWETPSKERELLQLSVEEVCADFDAMLRHDWRRLGISAEEVREFCVWRNAC